MHCWYELSFRKTLKKKLIINNINRWIIWKAHDVNKPLSAIIKNKWDINHIQTLFPNCHRCYKKCWRRSSLLRNVLNVKRRTPEKGIDICELPDDKNFKKICSKYELPFLDQANSSPDLSQILTL